MEFSKAIMRVFASSGVQLVENQYLATKWHSFDLKTSIRFYALTVEQ